MILGNLVLESNQEIAEGVFEAVFNRGGEAADVLPGQFISIYPKNPRLTLPRPFAIADAYNDRIKIVYAVVGKGTEELSSYTAGDCVKAVYPLGNGFELSSIDKYDSHVIVGGGVGVAPMLLLARTLNGLGCKLSAYLGYGNEPYLHEDIERFANKMFFATESGLYGEKGTVIDLLNKHDGEGGEGRMYYVCGPVPMLKAVCGYISKNGGEGQVSLEARMACGIGACVGCAVKVKTEGCDGWRYMKACKDGPVFDIKEVLWD